MKKSGTVSTGKKFMRKTVSLSHNRPGAFTNYLHFILLTNQRLYDIMIPEKRKGNKNMAIKFNSNAHAVRLDSLNINDTFIFDNRIGLVIEVAVFDAEWNTYEPKSFWIDLSTGKDFMRDEYTQMDGGELVTPIDLSVSIIK